MKKTISLILLICLSLLLVSCNQSMGFGNLTYNKIHIDTHSFSGCYTVEKWYESENGIEVKTKELGSIFASEGTYILVEDKCPVCDANK